MDEVITARHNERNSLLYWFPLLLRAKKEVAPELNLPETVIVKVKHGDCMPMLDGNMDEFVKKYGDKITEVVRSIGFPLFMRTDEFSGKHSYASTCYVPTEDELYSHIRNLVEDSECADIIELPIRALVFRKFLQLDSPFKFFEQFPVARERRYFIENNEVLCHHPYWDINVFRNRFATRQRAWADLSEAEIKEKELDKIDGITLPEIEHHVAQLNAEPEDEVALLSGLAKKVAPYFQDQMSVDFARDISGAWYLIDMALGKASWHPQCQYSTHDQWG